MIGGYSSLLEPYTNPFLFLKREDLCKFLKREDLLEPIKSLVPKQGAN